MRTPRKLLLGDGDGIVHLYWQCHNRSYLLKKHWAKSLYLRSLARALKKQKLEGKIKIYSFSIMDNHVHLVLKYNECSEVLSMFLRLAHSIFGLNYNRQQHRIGSVGAHRPRSPKIQNDEHAMRTHFYIEANPIRAKICDLKGLRKIPHNSHRYFAYGDVDDTNKFIEEPEWYKKLGKTIEERQRKYIELFTKYLQKFGLVYMGAFFKNYIGEQMWCAHQMSLFINEMNKCQTTDPPEILA